MLVSVSWLRKLKIIFLVVTPKRHDSHHPHYVLLPRLGQNDASTAGQVKKSVSGFLTHVHKVFTPDTAQDDDAEAYVLQDGQPVLLDRLQVSQGV